MNESMFEPTTPPDNFKDGLRSLEACLRNTEDSENIIEGLLRDATEYYGADRTYVLEADWNLGIFINTYEHCRNGVDSRRRICSPSRLN